MSQPVASCISPHEDDSEILSDASGGLAPFEPTRARDRFLDDAAPSMASLPKIFEDLVERTLREGFRDVLEGHLSNGAFGVATMCSGTESPLFALRMISKALANQGLTFNWEHIFSAEIVPFKQAFIERNFHPRTLFRDVTKLRPGMRCETAYGSSVTVPPLGKVQLLVAGFACVDFSVLNNIKRGLEIDIDDTGTEAANSGKADEGNSKKVAKPPGESSATFSAIYRYAKDFRPAIMILENVCGAPWAEIKSSFAEIQYAASYALLDSKDYYMPQTRQRGYMVCVNYDSMSPMQPGKAQRAAENTIRLTQRLARRASSSVEAFMLDNDSIVLQKALNNAAMGSYQNRPRREVDWAACEHRHTVFRKEEALGDGNHYTNWRSGRSIAPSYAHPLYHRSQVDRVKDTFDIMQLQAAKQGYDIEFKSRFPDVSQNVDRNLLNAPPGIIGCITPSGATYSTYRGGPIVGLEALALQGLPIDSIHLTRETQRQLQDLAGNAMTSTVVGTAIISALVCASEAIPNIHFYQPYPQSQVVMPAVVSSELGRARQPYLGPRRKLGLQELKTKAGSSAQLCTCEGQNAITTSPILICDVCNVTVCRRHSHSPKHCFRSLGIDSLTRANPGEFESILRDAIPLRLTLDLTFRMFEDIADEMKPDDWVVFSAALKAALGNEFFFESIARSISWKVTYRAPRMRLLLIIDSKVAQWKLFIDATDDVATQAVDRKLFREPIAIMDADKNINDVMQGQWKLRLPYRINTVVHITGSDDKTPSWKSELGIPEFQHEVVNSSLELRLPAQVSKSLRNQVEGIYDLLPCCGTSQRQLHKKRTVQSDNEQEPVFLFHDPNRIGRVEQDFMVLSNDHRRLLLSDTRIVIAELKYELLEASSDIVHPTKPWIPEGGQSLRVTCGLSAAWRECPALLAPAISVDTKLYALDDCSRTTLLNAATCDHGETRVLHGTMPWLSPDPDGLFRGGDWTFMDSPAGLMRSYLEWFIQAAPHPLGDSDKWIEYATEGTTGVCRSCCPKRPEIKWIASVKGKICSLKPAEDFGTTPMYEAKYKNRPAPIKLILSIDRSFPTNAMAAVSINLNPVALLHRITGDLPSNSRALSRPVARWRFITCISRNSGLPSLPTFTFRPTSDEAMTPFKFFGDNGKQFKLRPEQQQELTWMIGRDRDDCKPFVEEVVDEVRCQSLGAILEASVQRSVRVRGGVLADDVGFGKTVQIVALIKVTQVAAKVEIDHNLPEGRIGSRATIIFAPSTLVPQWNEEILKFWPTCNVICLSDATKIKSFSVFDIRKADVVIVPHKALTNPINLKRLAALAGLPAPPNLGQVRQIVSWLKLAAERLKDNTEDLCETEELSQWPDVLRGRMQLFETDITNRNAVPSKRLRGDAFQKYQLSSKTSNPGIERLPLGEVALATGRQSVKSEIDAEQTHIGGFEDAESVLEVEWPVLNMFRFHRKVVDEQTYVEPADLEAIKQIESHITWSLSATPALNEFEDVKKLADVLGIYLGQSDITRNFNSDLHVKSITSQMTDAEFFDAHIRDPSDSYYLHRQRIALSFIKFFVRSNERFGDSIAGSAKICPLISTPLERAVQAEIVSQLASDDVKYDNRLAKSNDPRELRMQRLLRKTGSNPQECLMIAASYDICSDQKNSAASAGLDHELANRYESVQSIGSELTAALKRLIDVLGPGDLDEFANFQKWLFPSAEIDMDPHIQISFRELFENAKTTINDQIDTEEQEGKHSKVKRTRIRDAKIKTLQLFNEMQNAFRGWQYCKTVSKIQHALQNFGDRVIVNCDCGCVVAIAQVFVNVRCGHSHCLKHHNERIVSNICGIGTCRTYVYDANILRAADLACFKKDAIRLRSRKFDAVADLIRSTAAEEQILVFAQHDSVVDEIFQTLNDDGITCVMPYEKSRSVAGAQKAQKTFTNFRNLKYAQAGWNKVMILNPTDSSAAGHNLTNAHIAIFVSPVLEEGGRSWADFYRQSIGRIRRPGQNRRIQVYHFVSLDTIDVNLMEDGLKSDLRMDGLVLRSAQRYNVSERRAAASINDMEDEVENEQTVIHQIPRTSWRSKVYDMVDWPDYEKSG